MDKSDDVIAQVPIGWFRKLLELKEMAEKNPNDLDYLMGYIQSAEYIIEAAPKTLEEE